MRACRAMASTLPFHAGIRQEKIDRYWPHFFSIYFPFIFDYNTRPISRDYNQATPEVYPSNLKEHLLTNPPVQPSPHPNRPRKGRKSHHEAFTSAQPIPVEPLTLPALPEKITPNLPQIYPRFTPNSPPERPQRTPVSPETYPESTPIHPPLPNSLFQSLYAFAAAFFPTSIFGARKCPV